MKRIILALFIIFCPVLLFAEFNPLLIELGQDVNSFLSTNNKEYFLESDLSSDIYITSLDNKQCFLMLDKNGKNKIEKVMVFFAFDTKYQLEEFYPRLFDYVKQLDGNNKIKTQEKKGLESDLIWWDHGSFAYSIEKVHDRVPIFYNAYIVGVSKAALEYQK